MRDSNISRSPVRGFKKTLKIAGVFVLFLAVWIAINSIDDAPVDDSVFVDQLKTVKFEENGYTVLAYLNNEESKLLSSEDVTSMKSLIHGSEEWDQAFVDKILDAHQQLFADINTSIEKPYFSFPVSKHFADLPRYSSYVHAGQLLELKYMNAFRHKQYDEAIDALIVFLRFAQAIKLEEKARLISYMVGLKMQTTALAWIHQIVSLDVLERHQIERLKVEVDAIPVYAKDKFGRAFIGEYQFVLDFLSEIMGPTLMDRYNYYKNINNLAEKYSIDEDEGIGFQRWLSESMFILFPYYYFHPNEVKAVVLPYYQKLQARASRYCNALDLPNIDGVEEVYSENWSAIVMPNSMTKQLLSAEANWQPYFHRVCFFYTYKDAVQAIIAMRLYYMDKGVMPAVQNQLVPDYLVAEPVDYFNGEKLHYSVRKQWFYSVGTDFKDDGGSIGGVYNGMCEEDAECNKNPTISYVFVKNATQDAKK